VSEGRPIQFARSWEPLIPLEVDQGTPTEWSYASVDYAKIVAACTQLQLRANYRTCRVRLCRHQIRSRPQEVGNGRARLFCPSHPTECSCDPDRDKVYGGIQRESLAEVHERRFALTKSDLYPSENTQEGPAIGSRGLNLIVCSIMIRLRSGRSDCNSSNASKR
jgi:hypothetical protein